MSGILVSAVRWGDRFSRIPCAAFPVASPSSCAPRSLPIPYSVECVRVCPAAMDSLRHTYPSNDLLNPLLVTLHLQEGLDLTYREVLPVSKRDELIEGAKQLEGISEDFPLIQCLAGAADDLSKQMERVNVL